MRNIALFLLIVLSISLLLVSCTKQQGDGEKRDAFCKEITGIVAAKYPEIRIERKKDSRDLKVTARSKKESVDLELTGLYEQCAKEPAKKNELIQAFLEEKLAPLALGTVVPFDEVCMLIMPRVVSKDWFSRLDNLKNCPEEQKPYNEALSDSIIITYVIDYPERIEYISRKNLTDWDLAPEKLRITATENLKKKTDRLEPQIMQMPEGKVVIYNSKDGYDSARLLLGKELKGIDSGKAAIIGIPHRDYCIVIQGTQKKMIQAAAKMVTEEFTSSSSPISDGLFTLKEGTLEKYTAQ